MARPCRDCGARITFVTMKSTGRGMPVDEEFIETYVVRGKPGPGQLTLVSRDGSLVHGRESSVTDPNAERVEGWRPHFVSCTIKQARRG